MTKPCIAIVSSGLPQARVLDAAIAARFGREGFECFLLAPDEEWLRQTCNFLRGQAIECQPLCIQPDDGAGLKALLDGLAVGHYISALTCSANTGAAATAISALVVPMLSRKHGTFLFSYRKFDFVENGSDLDKHFRALFQKYVKDNQFALAADGINVGDITPAFDSVDDAEQIANYAECCWQLHVAKPVVALPTEPGGSRIRAWLKSQFRLTKY